MTDDTDQKRLRQTISDEIHAIMDKHGVGGVVMLVSRESASWRMVFPDWSGLQPDPSQPGTPLRLRLSSKTPEARQAADSTMHLIASIRDMSSDCVNAFGRLFRAAELELQKQGSGIDHKPFGDGEGIDPRSRKGH
jgi:hypothetical protein